MKNLLISLAMLLVANITLAQNEKDSVQKVLDIQGYIIQTIGQHSSILKEELDSIKSINKRTEEMLFLISSGEKMLEIIKPKDSVFARQVVSNLIFTAFFDEEQSKEKTLESIQVLAKTNLLISVNIDEQNAICEEIISNINFTKQNEEVKNLLEKSHANEYQITQKFIENFIKNQEIGMMFNKFQENKQLLLKKMLF